MKSVTFAATLLALSLSFAAWAAPAFKSDKSHDYFGYYLPVKAPKAGPWRLRNLFIAPPADFRSFEAGREPKAFGAVMFEFDDVTSRKKINEMGQDYYSRDARVLPTTYALTASGLHFEGRDKALGPVVFDGTFAKGFFKKKGTDTQDALLHGTLTVGKRSFAVDFTWFGGD